MKNAQTFSILIWANRIQAQLGNMKRTLYVIAGLLSFGNVKYDGNQDERGINLDYASK